MTKPCSVYVGLLHHSMRDKNDRIVTTAVTNLDIHDIARSARTFGIKRYFLINPLAEQQAVVQRIIGHWQGPGGRDYNPDRSEAFERVQIVSWLKDAVEVITQEEGSAPELIMTSAREVDGVEWVPWLKLREDLALAGRAKLIIFGTGWGMTEEMLREADWVLKPIVPRQDSGYNHLSVRSAVAITLDRLLGERS